MERISDTSVTRDPIPTRYIAERCIAESRKKIKNTRAENQNPRKISARLTRIEAIAMMNMTINPNGRRVEADLAQQKAADGDPDDIKIPTRMALLKTVLRHCRNVRTS